MAYKLFIACVLVCSIQGLNAAIFDRPAREQAFSVETALYRESLQYFQNLEKEYGSIIDRFENVISNIEAQGPEAEFSGNFDSIMSSLEEFASTDMNEEAATTNIIRECIRAERENFQALVKHIRQRTIDAAVELRQFICDNLSPYVKAAREAFNVLGDAVALFPAKMWECIKEGNIMKAIEVVKETVMIVRTNANLIGENLREARTKFPLIREKAKQMREQIMNEVTAGMKVIRGNIRKCIISGGPKPVLPAVILEQVPIPQDINPAISGEQVSTLIAPADAVVDKTE